MCFCFIHTICLIILFVSVIIHGLTVLLLLLFLFCIVCVCVDAAGVCVSEGVCQCGWSAGVCSPLLSRSRRWKCAVHSRHRRNSHHQTWTEPSQHSPPAAPHGQVFYSHKAAFIWFKNAVIFITIKNNYSLFEYILKYSSQHLKWVKTFHQSCPKTKMCQLWWTFLIHFCILYFCNAKLNFQHHYSSLQCHMILQKSFLYADLLLKKHFLLLLMLKTVVLIIILWNNHKCDFRILWWMENSNQQHLFETDFL